MQKKIDSLKQLLKTVEENEKLATGRYCKGENNCVIGHLLKNGGVSQEQLKEIDDGVFGHNYAIYSILVNAELSFVSDALESLGFDVHSDVDLLDSLQDANDNGGRESAIKHLNETIKTLEEN